MRVSTIQCAHTCAVHILEIHKKKNLNFYELFTDSKDLLNMYRPNNIDEKYFIDLVTRKMESLKPELI